MAPAAPVKSGTYRLARLVRMPGGRSDADILRRAEASLARAKSKQLPAFDAAIADLKRIIERSDVDVREVYRKALMVSELGGLVGFERAGRAGYLLCDWIERASGDEAGLRRGLPVYVDAIRVLRIGTTHPDEQAAVLQGLEALGRQPLKRGS